MTETYKALAEPLPEKGIQRTKGTETRKGYDTTGYGYQYAVNRFNEVCGLDGWGYFYTIVQAQEGTFRSGATNWHVVAEVSIWVGTKDDPRTMPGSHLAGDYGDALKGAITNAFKKAAAMWGVGRQAYEGAIDEDNLPAKEGLDQVRPKASTTSTPKPTSPLVQEAQRLGATVIEEPEDCPTCGEPLTYYATSRTLDKGPRYAHKLPDGSWHRFTPMEYTELKNRQEAWEAAVPDALD